MKKNNKILFYPINQTAADLIEPPSSSSKYNIPDWLKNLTKYSNKDNTFIYKYGENNLTAKSCLPLIDGFTSGYTIVLDRDVEVERDEYGKINIHWGFGPEDIKYPITQRAPKEAVDMDVCGFDNFYGYDDLMFSWFPFWCIKTPKGYSSILIHPVNRVDLPFYTIGGVVDTDGWGEAGNHPFLIKSGWSGTIKAGTPIIQIIPFKRENWTSVIDKTMIKEYVKKIYTRNRKLKSFYKDNIWNNKIYR